MRLVDHESHKWRYSDSSYYDFICDRCGAPKGSRKAGEPCPVEEPPKDESDEVNRS